MRYLTQSQFQQVQRELNASSADPKEIRTGEFNLSTNETDTLTSIGLKPIDCTITTSDGKVEEVTLTFGDEYKKGAIWDVNLEYGEPLVAQLRDPEVTLTMELNMPELTGLGFESCIEG